MLHKSPFEPVHAFPLLWRGTWEPMQMCGSGIARAFAASTWDLDTNRLVQWLYLLKCVDSPVFTAGEKSTQIAIWGSTRDFGTVTNVKVSLCKCVDSKEPSLLAQNSIKSPFEPARDFLNCDSNGDLMLLCASGEGPGESTHLHRLTWAFVTVPKSHVLPQTVICVTRLCEQHAVVSLHQQHNHL